jgi:hypothetical protein
LDGLLISWDPALPLVVITHTAWPHLPSLLFSSVVRVFIMAGVAEADFLITTASVLPVVLGLLGPLTTPFTYQPIFSDHWILYYSPTEILTRTGFITNSLPLDCQLSNRSRFHPEPIYSPGTGISSHCGKAGAAEGTLIYESRKTGTW